MENAAIGVRNIWQNTSPVSQSRAAKGPLSAYSLTNSSQLNAFSKVALPKRWFKPIESVVSYSHTPLSPTGTWDGDIHMPNESRMVVDEYAKVDAIPIGDHSSNAVYAFADCG